VRAVVRQGREVKQPMYSQAFGSRFRKTGIGSAWLAATRA